jgi:hypothetical protein
VGATVTRLTRTWRGVIRGQLHSVNRRIDSLLHFQEKHESKFVFLYEDEITLLAQAAALCQEKLDQVGSPPGLAKGRRSSPSPAASTDPS